MKVKSVKPITTNDNDEVEIHLAPDAANDDWIRAGRLKEAADNGDEEAAKELEQLEEDDMVYLEEESE